MKRSVTIKDVAQHAGVSTATVSRVLNNTGYASAEVIEKVKKVVQEIGYHPNEVARGLKNARTKLVALMISDITNPFFSTIVKGAESVLLSEGYTTVLCSTDKDVDKERLYLQLMLENRVAGFIVSAASDRFKHFQQAQDTPIVFVNRRPEGYKAPAVLVNNYKGAYEAAHHLIEAGHQCIATIAGSQDINTGRDRLSGYRQALLDSGNHVYNKYVKYGDFQKDSGYQEMLGLLACSPRPTAVFVANNQMTLGAVIAIREKGLEIGKDISLIGFDDSEWASVMTPALTTIRQPTFEMGVEAAKLLTSYMSRNVMRPRGHELYLDPQLIIRQSVIKSRC